MATQYLLGRGELLTTNIKAPPGGGSKKSVYTFNEALENILPEFKEASNYFDSIPDVACPEDFTVAELTLNPSYIAKSFYPSKFLREVGLFSLGSRTDRVLPRRWSKQGRPEESLTTTIYAAGTRSAFRNLPNAVESFDKNSREAVQFAQTEHFSAFQPISKLKKVDDGEYFEVGLQFIRGFDDGSFKRDFADYVLSFGGEFFEELQFLVSNLWFVPIRISADKLVSIAEYAFVRVLRSMPRLRGVRPITRTTGVKLAASLPDSPSLSSEPKVAILDGGVPEDNVVERWLTRNSKMDESKEAIADGEEHGLGVTSAFLFGPMTPGEESSRPYANVAHFRVIDERTDEEDPLELYRTLGFIEEILLSRQYQFINLSLGPDLPIEDADIHAWTSVIDSLIDDGETLLAVAAGNNGEYDRESGNARVQVPGDCVNALTVGASDICDTENWQRATYSAIGPGRSPGVIKPDLLAFGGSIKEYFHHISTENEPTLVPNQGTSFASPYALRSAVGIRAVLGTEMSPLAIKALLVHCAEKKNYPLTEAGWGAISDDLSSFVNCPDGLVRIVYQGELKAGKYLRATVPVPENQINGMVNMKATFCYACPTDPEEAASYTRAGLDITFRTDLNKVKKGKSTPEPRSFFKKDKYSSEGQRRSDHGKWETVIHDEARMRGSTLKKPVFDIHYNAREGGDSALNARKIKYALIITIQAPKHANLYNDVLQTYSNILVPLQAQLGVPIQT